MPLFVQKFNTGGSALSGTSITVNTTSQTAQNTNVLVVSWGNSSGTTVNTTILSVSDGTNSYTPIGNPSQCPSASQAIAIQAFQLVGIPGGSKTITITFSASVNFAAAGVSEYAAGVVFRTSAAAALVSGQGVTPFNSSKTFANANDLVMGIVADFNGTTGLTPGSGFTNRDSFYTVYVEDQQVTSAGAIAASVGKSGNVTTSTIQALVFTTPTSVVQSASGEVLLNDTFIGSAGTPATLQNGGNWTFWVPGAGSQWVQANAGAPVKLTRFKYGIVSGCEDMLSGATLQGSNDPLMNGAVTLWTASVRSVSGALQTIITLNQSTAYQYYRLTIPAGSMTGQGGANALTCLDLYTNWVSGCVFQPSDLVISPSGLNFDKPTLISLSSSTASASIFYTTDGSTPTTSSTPYTGPFLVSTSCRVNAIASSPASNGNSRLMNIDPTATGNTPTGYPVHIGNTEVSLDNSYDDRGYRVWAMNGTIFQDPVSKWWYRYGVNTDSPQIYIYGFPGNNVYKSADLRNWQYAGVIQQAATQNCAVTNSTWHILPRVLYNASTTTYVIWCDSYQQSGGSFVWQGKTVWTSSSPIGPFTLVRTITTFPGGITDPEGDFTLFLDTDGVTAYFLSTMKTTAANDTLFRAQLTSDYTNISATTSAVPWSGFSSTSQEAPCMVSAGGVYFFIHSDTLGFQGTACRYNTISSVMGTLSPPQTLPFQPVAGGTPDYTISYNSQVWQLLAIPGRTGGYVFHGDQYGPPSTVMSQFSSLRRIRLPITFSGSTMSISWLPAWSLDAAMPSTGANSPAAPRSLTVNSSTGAAQWTNQEPNPCKLYFDVATDSGFNNIVSSNALPDGSTSFTAPVSTTYYYRVRNVNASGFSVSNTVSFGAAPPIFPSTGVGNPPFQPVIFPTSVPAISPGGGWNTYTGPQEDGASAYANAGVIRYNGQSQTSKINQTWRP